MEDRIDPLIVERAPWLGKPSPYARVMRKGLDRLLGYRTTVDLATSLKDAPPSEIMARMAERLCKMVDVQGLGNIPRFGPALVVANHPTGIADGIVLQSLIARVRDDAYFFANRDILRVLPQMESMIAPVEWRLDKRSHGKTRETMAYVHEATAEGRLGVIFPSGRLAKRRGIRLYERPWMASAAMLARKYDLPVVPINIQARNSVLFYLFDALHPTLRDITLFHETLNKDRQPYRVNVGEPISASAIPRDAKDGIAFLRDVTLALGGRDAPTVNMLRSSRIWA
ncbi:1-acyl-sn-glycerol-3-phosphate acyltransferase [Yoonia sp.]|uniref:1-acyl-sn-glycerol-3-phosphate acyltransferase n=1 Tax=Yoonia sp. TaxID=2212373 RepID=UPI002FDB5BC8